MKNGSSVRGLALTAALAALLGGCATPAAAKSGVVLDDIYTSVAMTVAAQSTLPGATPTATDTWTPVPTPTVYPTATLGSDSSTTGYVYPYAGVCNNAAYVSDVTITDGSEVAPGGTFTKTWQLLNTAPAPGQSITPSPL